MWCSSGEAEVHVYIRLLPHYLNSLHTFSRIESQKAGPGAFVEKCIKTGIRGAGCEHAPADCYKGGSELASIMGCVYLYGECMCSF